MFLSQNDESRIMIDDVCEEALRILNAMKHPDISYQMEEDKEFVFDRVTNKIETDSYLQIQENKKKNFIRYIVAASIACIFMISIVSAYYIGHYSGQKLPGQVYAEVLAPYGITTQLILADGTKVTLNGGSRLTYPTIFTGKERMVALSGEGFFDVTKDVDHPFVVNSGKLSVKVLGTKFGFKSYGDDRHTIVTLKAGLVKVIPLSKEKKNGIVLEPNQQLILDNHTGEYLCRNVNTEEYISWKDGILCFRDFSLDEIVRILERRFDVKIQILSDEIKNDRYFAHFEHGENLEQILTLLSHKRPWKYENINGVIEIKKVITK